MTAAVRWGSAGSFAGRVLAPVHTITSRAQQISADSLDERVSLGGPHDELRELADTFDALLGPDPGARSTSSGASWRRCPTSCARRWPTSRPRSTSRSPTPTRDGRAPRGREVALDQNRRAARTIEALLALARVQSGEGAARPSRSTSAVVSEVAAASPTDDVEWHVELVPATVPGTSTYWRAPSRTSWTTPRPQRAGGRVDVGSPRTGRRPGSWSRTPAP